MTNNKKYKYDKNNIYKTDKDTTANTLIYIIE